MPDGLDAIRLDGYEHGSMTPHMAAAKTTYSYRYDDYESREGIMMRIIIFEKEGKVITSGVKKS